MRDTYMFGLSWNPDLITRGNHRVYNFSFKQHGKKLNIFILMRIKCYKFVLSVVCNVKKVSLRNAFIYMCGVPVILN